MQKVRPSHDLETEIASPQHINVKKSTIYIQLRSLKDIKMPNTHIHTPTTEVSRI